jgi:uncharacterized protein YbaR (Trm112 family)
MFIELVDALRCPRTHEESWLVASATRMEARHIVDGTLGCPVCMAEYPIRDGVVDFRREGAPPIAEVIDSSGELAMRTAALLDLTDATGFAVLTGAWGGIANELSRIVETPLIVVDPPGDVVGMPGISVVRCDDALPIAPAAARALALDGGSEARVRSAVSAVKAKGRIMGATTLDIPAGPKELARDAPMWVAERELIPSPLVTLHVRRG